MPAAWSAANRVVLAPMSGVTDAPFRRLAARLGAGLVVSEMTASAQLVVETVTVKDKSGKIVEGLTAKDFTVTELFAKGLPISVQLGASALVGCQDLGGASDEGATSEPSAL